MKCEQLCKNYLLQTLNVLRSFTITGLKCQTIKAIKKHFVM
jgi:hypothetical protein